MIICLLIQSLAIASKRVALLSNLVWNNLGSTFACSTSAFLIVANSSSSISSSASGFQDSYRSVIIPLGKGTDAKTGTKLSRLSYRYKNYGGYSRMMKVTTHGIWGDMPNDEFDHKKYNALHEGGTELMGVETFGCVVPS